VRELCEASPDLLDHGEDYIVYSILEFIVGNFGPVIDKVRADVSQIEDQVLKRELPRAQIERLYRLRRSLLKLRDAITPLLDVCRRLESSDVVAIDQEMQQLFRQVTHHVDRTRDDIDSLREVLSFAFEVSLMMGQSEQTVITRQLAAWAAILAVPTAIAGLYGMNFENMPELRWQYGYAAAIVVIAAVCGTLYWRFRKNKWL
jgi:magnesium transporter